MLHILGTLRDTIEGPGYLWFRERSIGFMDKEGMIFESGNFFCVCVGSAIHLCATYCHLVIHYNYFHSRLANAIVSAQLFN
jgi:hypothetical protein